MRAGADAWLLATFLLLFGAAIATSVPASPGAPSSQRTHSLPDAQNAAANSERGLVRVPSRVVRAVQAKGAGGGSDLLPVHVVDVACAGTPAEIFIGEVSRDLRLSPCAFQARAPPLLTA